MKEVTHELQEMVSSRDILTDIVREILENRAEIYKALNQETKEESEEEGPTQEDLDLQEHLKLQAAIAQSKIGRKRFNFVSFIIIIIGIFQIFFRRRAANTK